MNLIQTLILGILAGITELLPVSGSAHQRLLEELFGFSESSHLMLRPMLHLGVLLAIVLSLRKELRSLFRAMTRLLGSRGGSGRKKRTSAAALRSRRSLTLVLVASVPLFALPFLRGFVARLNGNLFFLGAMLILTGIVLYTTRWYSESTRKIHEMTTWDAVLIGLCQIPSVLTGLSRSGLTMACGMWRGLDQQSAVDFSYLVAVPALFGTVILEFADAISGGVFTWGAFLVGLAGMAAAMAFGWAAVRLLRFLIRKGTFSKLAYYCWGMGLMALLLALAYI